MTLLPIFLQEGFIAKISVNDKLKTGDVIAERKRNSKEEVIHFSSDYKIPPNKILKVLKKNLGDSIQEGSVIAIKKKLFGGQEIVSKISGTIVKIDEEKGDIYVKTLNSNKDENEQLFSPVDGVVEICNNEKIVIKTDKDIILAEDSLGGEASGEIIYFANLEENKLNSNIAGKIILVKLLDKVSFYKIMGLDAAGIITQEIEDTDFIDLIEKRIQTPVMNVTDEDFKKIVKRDGKQVYLNGKDKSIAIL